MQELSASKKSYGPVIALFIAFAVIFLVWLYWGSNLVWWTAVYWRNKLANDGPPDPTLTIAELGQIGDLFGGVNSLFASFAFIGVAFAAYYQRQTFLHQLKDSRDNAEALESSNLTNAALLHNAKQELFNGMFFRMVTEVHSMIARLELTNFSLYGDEFARNITLDEKLVEIEENVEILYRRTKHVDLTDPQQKKYALEDIQETHDQYYESNTKTLGPFFRNLYHTFKIIKDSDMNYSEQCKYSKIARASVNEKILVLVMLNGLTKQGRNLKDLIERYGLLKHLGGSSENPKPAAQLARLFYKESAFLGYGGRVSYYKDEQKKTSEK